MTGGVGMLAGGPIAMLAQTQHLTGPDSHTTEVVAGGTNLHFIVPINGTLQEFHIRCGSPTPCFFDSQTTVFVCASDTGVKRSAWILRRVRVLQEGESSGQIKPVFIPGTNMVADAYTKYLAFAIWRRLMYYVLNDL